MFTDLPPNYETAEDLARDNRPRLQVASLMGVTQVFGAMPHRGPGFERTWIQMLDLYHQLHGYLDKEIGRVLDALEARYPVLRGTIRDHSTKERRPYLRFFACMEDLSHESPDAPLPDEIAAGREPFIVLGAIAGG